MIIEQPAFSSDVVALAGGGLAVEIDSDGSRNKFHIIAPVRKVGGRFYVDCVYKSAYDSVDEARSAGTFCRNIELGKFDVSAAINDDGLKFYAKDYAWLKSIAPSSCANAVGFEYGHYHIV